MKKKCLISKENKKEIFYNLINAALAGGLVLIGSLTSGELTARGLLISFIAALAIMITKFKEYWDSEKSEYSRKVFSFVSPTV
jgi:hypothetical protein